MEASTNIVAPRALNVLIEAVYGQQLDGVLHSSFGDLSGMIRDVTNNSKMVTPESLFCCLVGDQADGHDFAQDAVDAGAGALLVQRKLPIDVTQVVVGDTRRAMGEFAAALYEYPSNKLRVVGVTGTNGKTSTAHLLGAIFRQQGVGTRVLGTLSGARTTPESCDLQKELWQAQMDGAQVVVMEVTSHAMSLHRVVGTNFAAAIFLNLSPEHLDFHETQEQYFAAKARLFQSEFTNLGIINRDDVHGRLLLDTTEVETVSFGLDDVSEVEVSVSHHAYVWRGRKVHVNLGGKFNVLNSLAAATAAASLGVGIAEIIAGLAVARSVPGRFESVTVDAVFNVIVDYAHTPDALGRVLDAAREIIAPGSRIILVFGCGGDRDKMKRPLMGNIAAQGADCVFVTSDNPRSEEPLDIAQQIIAGVVDNERKVVMSVELDRRSAIELALMTARKGDLVIIAGKGHETTQTIGDRILPFNDALVAQELIGELS
jgi:UDP-N-acetylmuramoyl-L-alanyl-D-glutamate--2,6-diaminopimelate ligase